MMAMIMMMMMLMIMTNDDDDHDDYDNEDDDSDDYDNRDDSDDVVNDDATMLLISITMVMKKTMLKYDCCWSKTNWDYQI